MAWRNQVKSHLDEQKANTKEQKSLVAHNRSVERIKLSAESASKLLKEKTDSATSLREAGVKGKERISALAEVKAANDHLRNIESEKAKLDAKTSIIQAKAEKAEREYEAKRSFDEQRANTAQKIESAKQKTIEIKAKEDLNIVNAKSEQTKKAEESKTKQLSITQSDPTSRRQEQIRSRIESEDPKRYGKVVDLVRKLFSDMKGKDEDVHSLPFDTGHGIGDLKSKLETAFGKIFPRGIEKEDKQNLERHAMYLAMAREWAILKSEDKSKTGNFKLGEDTRQVNGSIYASKEVAEKAVLRIVSGLQKFPMTKLAKAIKISSNMKEAFASDPVRLKLLERSSDGKPVMGFYDAETGALHLFTDHIPSEIELAKTILHEVTHLGLDNILTKENVAQYSAIAQKMFNANSYARKVLGDLVERGHVKDNDSVLLKLHEVLAHMAEDINATKTSMAKGMFSRMMDTVRSFIHTVISKIAGKDFANKWIETFSDHEVIDMVRKMTNKGFESLDKMKGDRLTTEQSGQLVSEYTFRRADDLVQSAGSKMVEFGKAAEEKHMGILGHAMESVGNKMSVFGDKDVETRPLNWAKSSQTKAALDKSGQIEKAVHAMQKMVHLGHSFRNEAINIFDPAHMISMIDGSGVSVLKDVSRSVKAVFNYDPERSSKFIGEHLIEKDSKGNMKYQSDADIERIFNSRTAEHGLNANLLPMIKRTYKTAVNAEKNIESSKSKASIKEAMDRIIAASPEAKRSELEKFAIDSYAIRTQTMESMRAAFDNLKAAAGDSRTARDMSKTVSAIESHMKSIDSNENGYLPMHRHGDFAVKAVETFKDSDGQMKERTLHRQQFTSPGAAKNSLESIKSGLHIRDQAERDSYVKGVADGRVKITQEDAKSSKSSADNAKDLAKKLDLIDQDKSLSDAEKQLKRQAVFEESNQEFVKNVTDDHNAYKNSNAVISGYDTDIRRGIIKSINNKSDAASRIAVNAELTKALMDSRGRNRDEIVKMMEASSKSDNEVVKSLKGLTYIAYLGGSVASAALQHFQQYILAAPVLSQYMKSGGFAKSQYEIMRASKDIALGWQKLEKTNPKEYAALKDAIDKGYFANSELVNAQAFVQDGISNKSKALGAISHGAGALMTAAETNNRMATFLAAHRLFDGENFKTNAKGAEKFGNFNDFANQCVVDAHFDTQKYNRSNIERSELGSLMFQFHMFPIRMVETVSRLPMRQKMEAMGMLLLLSGAGGLPFMSNLEDVIDAGGEWLGIPMQSKRMRTEAINAALGRDVGTIVNRGVFTAAGLDFGSRIGIGDIIPFTSALSPSNPDVTKEMTKSVGASFNWAGQMISAIQDVSKGEYRSAALKALPSSIANVAKGAEMISTGKQLDSKGMVARDGVTTYEGVMKMLGFGSTAAAIKSEFGEVDKQTQEQHSFFQQKFMRAFAKATVSGDQSDIQESLNNIKEFNKDKMGTPMMIRMDAAANVVKQIKLGMTMESVDRKIMTSHGPERLYWINAKQVMGSFK